MKFYRSTSMLKRKKEINLKLELLEDRSVPSVSLGASFDGMNANDTACMCQPPDTIAAVGPNHVVEMVNTAIRISDRSGATQSTTELSSFFSPVFVGPNQSDPFVMYDELAGRFVVGILDFPNGAGPNYLDFAVSNGDPSSGSITWTFAIYSVGEGSFSADYPRAGWNADGYFVSFNMFSNTSNSFDHVQTLTINKSTLAVASQHDYSSSLFTVTPAIMHGATSGGPEYFVESSSSGGSSISIVTETNVLSSSPTFTITSVSVPAYRTAPAPTQPGRRHIASFDARIFDAAFRTTSDGVSHLVAAHQIGLPHSKLGYARWYDFNVSGTPTLIQSGNQGGVTSNSTAFMPSVDINSAGSIGLNFDESSKSEFWSMYVTGRTASMPLGMMQTPVLAVAGTAISPDSRVGDFSAITVDPSDGLTFWAANEYQGSAFWNTHIASFTVSGTAAPVRIDGTASSDFLGVLGQSPSQSVTPEQNEASVGLMQATVSVIEWQTVSQAMGARGTAAIDSFWADLASLEVVQSDVFDWSDGLA
jgi:hypothetical protein